MKLRSRFLLQVRVVFDDPQILADAPLGTRRIFLVKQGSFTGPSLQGEVLPGGSDWVLLRRDGVAELEIKFTLKTDNAQLIYMRCAGIFVVSPEVSQRIRNGEEVDSSEYYFRTAPLFETGAKQYDHLNRLIAVGVGKRNATGMVTEVFAIE